MLLSEANDSAEIVRAQRPYGRMPLIVLTSDVRVDLKGAPISTAQMQHVARAYQLWQQQIAALSMQGAEFVMEGCGESPPEDCPSRVVSAITEVVEQVRGGGKWRRRTPRR